MRNPLLRSTDEVIDTKGIRATSHDGGLNVQGTVDVTVEFDITRTQLETETT